MIFNEMNTSSAISYEGINESPYELGIGGALMHVYENECNYNALMKAAALSELKYYNENGGDLFVQEAGAFSGFLAKVKAFFKKVIEKIKSIFKKFAAMINSYAMKDKDFVKKYSKDLYRVNLKDFEFNGYKFEKLKDGVNPKSYTDTVGSVKADSTPDDIQNTIEGNRGDLVPGKSGKMDESEFREELHEYFYGDKDDISVSSVREYLNIITNHNEAVKKAETAQKEIIKKIEDAIKDLEKTSDEKIKDQNNSELNDAAKDMKLNSVHLADKKVQVYRAYANDLTVLYGAYVKALNDQNRQAKAICVKALSYKPKNESAVAEGGYSNIFDGVEIV